jgi:hypothetical protein
VFFLLVLICWFSCGCGHANDVSCLFEIENLIDFVLVKMNFAYVLMVVGCDGLLKLM